MLNPNPNENATIDLTEAARFLELIDSTATSFTFQTFDDDADRKDKDLARIRHGTLRQHAKELSRLNTIRGAGVFVTINETDGKGRKAENIAKVRAVFADLDGVPLGPAVVGNKLIPHIVVETSPGHHHVYWRVDGMALQDFTPVQLAISERFDGDPIVKDLPRVMRLPEFLHAKVKDGICCNPFMSRIVHGRAAPAYPAANFERAKDDPHQSGEKNDASPIDLLLTAGALEVIPNVDLKWYDWNRIGMATWRATDGAPYGFEAFDTWSAKSSKYNSTRTKKVWRGYFSSPPERLGIGTLIYRANQVDPQWRQKLMAEAIAEMQRAR